MKPFQFKRFSILQDDEVFRVGTDAVLLGALSSAENHKNILEIGSGTGIISLMLAQRNLDAKIKAIDINKKASQLSAINFKNSPYFSRISAENMDFNDFKSENKFNLIICNPPYFEATPQSDKDEIARQKIHLNFSQLIENSAYHLNDNGIFSVIIPFDSAENFEIEALNNSLYLSKKINIFGRQDLKTKRVILEFKKEITLTEISEFIIEKSPRKFSDQYLEITKDFHLFK
ncbi:tRNA1(Val) (adenine(37)-N6)-methyltransferase [Halpernia frigidisoli]|uniref:tRNA1Val (Adenine37-N6)-methyltransferase n=1 Tax=Halpernia frigidisoli TaxID=1125876 RepID=A0A1I3HYR7_9FLAO|nr:methyltransferase [Halpernia frigidisoli]SFI40753.1 tRNA1Val (adenine37-N6)-methyltransferase [Halpernia frigidisoli]